MHADSCYYNDNYRPRTPPEKRYSASFGTRVPDRKFVHTKTRPNSHSFVYENVHANYHENECYTNKFRIDNNHHYDIKVGNFPKPEFSRMYIQENFD